MKAQKQNPRISSLNSLVNIQNVFDDWHIGIVLADQNNKFIDSNEVFSSMLGYSMEELMSLGIEKVTHPDHLEPDLDAARNLFSGNLKSYTTVKKYIRKNNTVCWANTKVSVVEQDGVKYLLAMIDDITSRKQIELELEEHRNKIQKINDCLTNLGQDHTENINRLTALCGELTKACCAMYNRLEGEFLCSVGQWQLPDDYPPISNPDGHICFDLIQNDSEDIVVIPNLKDTNFAITDPNVLNYNLVTYCGKVVRCEGKAVGTLCVVYDIEYPISEDEKKIIGIISSAIGNEDVRKNNAIAIKESERILNETEKISDTGGWEYNVLTSTLSWTDETYKIYGLEQNHTAIDLHYAISFFPKEEQEVIRKVYFAALEKGEDWDLELPIHSADGKTKWVRTIGKPISANGQVTHIRGNLTDITERKLAELRLHKHLEEQQFLSREISRIQQLSTLDAVYTHIGKSIYKLVSEAYIGVVAYEPASDYIQLRHILGAEHLVPEITKILGFSPFSLKVSMSELSEGKIDSLLRSNLTRHNGNFLNELSAHKLSSKVSHEIKKLMESNVIYSIGFSHENKTYGGILILVKDEDADLNTNLIETLVNQASAVLQRLIAEDELRTEHANLQSILASSPVGMIILDENQNIVQSNQAAANLFNMNIHEMNKLKCGDFLGCINRAENEFGCGHSSNCHRCVIYSSISKAIEHCTSFHDFESEVIQEGKDGPLSIWFRFSIEPIHLNSRLHLILALQDITQSKKSAEALKKTHEHYQKLIEKAPDGIALVSGDGKFLYASPSAIKMFGYNQAEMLNFSPDQLTHPEDLPMVLDNLMNLLQDPTLAPIIQYRFKNKDGSWRWIESTLSNLVHEPSVQAIVINFRDITERKQAEQALNDSEKRFRSLIENSADAIIIIDKDANIMYQSPAYARIMGRSSEERLGKNGFEFIHPDNKNNVEEALKWIIKNPGETIHVLLCNLHPDGKYRWLDCMATSMLDDELIQGIVVNMHDVTLQKETEFALRDSESKYRGLFEANKDGITIFYVNPDDSLSNFVEVNKAAASMIGFSREEFQNFSVMDLELGVGPEMAMERKKQLLTKGFVNTETKIKHKNGNVLDVELIIIPIQYNNRTALMNIVRDITERKKVEKDLRESEERWSFAIEGSNDGIWDWDIQHDQVYYSRRWKEMLGYEADELENTINTWSDLLHPDDFRVVMKAVEKYFNKETAIYQTEHRLRCKNGEYKWILDRGKVLVYDKNGKPARMVGTHTDITEKKVAEETLKLSEEKYRRLTDNAVDIIFRLELEPYAYISYISPSVETITGFPREEFLAPIEAVTNKLIKEDGEKLIKLITSRIPPQEPVVLRWIDKKGGFVWLESRVVPIYSPEGVLVACEGISRDITANMIAQEALNESELRFRTLYEGNPDAIFLADIETGILVGTNPAASALLGKDASEIIGMHQSELHPKKNRKYSIDTFYLKSKETLPLGNLKPTENTVVRADGTEVPVEILANIINFKGRKVLHGIFRDITERKRSEMVLKASEELTRAVLNSLHAHVAVLDSDGNIISVNEPWRKFGAANGVVQLIGHIEKVNYLQVIQTAIKTGDKQLLATLNGIKDVIEGKQASYEQEYPCHTPTEKHWFSMHVTPLSFGISGAVVTHEDITVRKLTEEALRENEEKLQTLINSSPDIICFKDEAGRWIEANDSILKLYHLQSIDYRNKRDIDLAGHTAEIFKDAFVKSEISDELAWSFPGGSRTEEIIPDTEGNVHVFDVIKKPLFDQVNNRKGLVVYGRDITTRKLSEKALKESEDKFRTLAESSPYAIMIYQDDHWVYTNPAGLRICGYTEEEIGKMKFWELAAPEYQTMITKLGRARQKSERPDASFEIVILDKSGNRRWIYLTGSSLTYKGKPAGIISAVDITDRKQAEDEVMKERMLLRTLIDNLPDTIYVKDKQARKVLANKADLAILGIESEAEVLGKTDLDFMEEDRGSRGYKDDMRVLKTGKPLLNKEEDFIDKHNQQHWLLTSKIPLKDEKSQVTGLVGIGRDITTRKLSDLALKNSEKRYRTLFNEMIEGFALHEIILNHNNEPVDYRFIDLNPAFERITGLRAKEIIGKTVLEVLPRTEKIWIENYGKVAMSGKATSFENYSSELQKYYYVLAFSPEKGQFATMVADITDRKKAEDEVKKLNTELEERVKQRTQELEKAVREMESFSYSVSHDLRSPLRAIDGFSQILVEEYASAFDKEGLRILDVIRDNTRRMDQLISDLLALSRVSRFELKVGYIDMNALVNNVINELSQHSGKLTHTLEIKEMERSSGDSNLLKQVWLNLISNAIKYSRQKPESKIEIGSFKDGDFITYYIKDEGVGFNPEYSHKLFGVFQRLHKASDFEGTGVGLAIVNRIISRHNGKVWAEGQVNKGATFYFSLPRQS